MIDAETPSVRLVCGGRGTHRVKRLDRLYRLPTGGWGSGWVDAVDDRRTIHQDARGTWHMACPECRLPPKPLSRRKMDRLLDGAVSAGVPVIDLSVLNL